jgi:hypothetical protein
MCLGCGRSSSARQCCLYHEPFRTASWLSLQVHVTKEEVKIAFLHEDTYLALTVDPKLLAFIAVSFCDFSHCKQMCSGKQCSGSVDPYVLGPPGPDPLVVSPAPDPYPSVIKQK